MTALVASLVLLAGPRPVATCIAASERAQTAKLAARYREAKEGFTTCSHPDCPQAIRVDCAKGLTELEALEPTVVFAVRDEKGLDVPQAELLVDGAKVSLDGRPLPLDPGPHAILVRRGRSEATQTVVVSAGEKGRVLTFTAPPEVLSNPEVTPPPTSAPASKKSLVGPIVVSALSVVGFGLFAGFGLAGLDAYGKLERQPCAVTKTCLESQQAPIRTQFLVADIGLVTGIVAAIGALVWWLVPGE